MRYIMYVFKSPTKGRRIETVQFVYKYPRFCKNKDIHTSYFLKECTDCLKYRFKDNDDYIFNSIKKITGLKIFFMNIFLPSYNKIIKIPEIGSKVTVLDEYYEYFIKRNTTWWKISKDIFGNGSKQYELAKYNGFSVRHQPQTGDFIRIPYYLVD